LRARKDICAIDMSRRFQATAMPDRDWWEALWPDPRAVLEQIGVSSGVRAVDLCSGDGYFTVPMATLTHTEVVAVELDPEMIAAAQLAAVSAGVQNIRFVEGDAMYVHDLLEGPVDLVLIANTLHGAHDKTTLARSVRSVLRDGGVFVVINWWPRPREETPVLGEPRGPRQELRFSPEQVDTWLQPAGFVLDEVKDVGPYHYAAIFRAAEASTTDDSST
jgi:SAM-dependent methyltransferase